jgi:uncharacterized protein with HEPN domain
VTRPHPERIPAYLQDILDSAGLLQAYLQPCTRETFASEGAPTLQLTLVRDSVVRRLEIIGQALHNIHAADPAYAQHAGLDVQGWYGLRSKISHGYENIDYGLLWGVVQQDVPPLAHQVRRCLQAWHPPSL